MDIFSNFHGSPQYNILILSSLTATQLRVSGLGFRGPVANSGYIGILDKNMETIILGLYRDLGLRVESLGL